MNKLIENIKEAAESCFNLGYRLGIAKVENPELFNKIIQENSDLKRMVEEK